MPADRSSYSDALLQLPAATAAHLVALELLDELVRARQRLGSEAEPEAVHDFRVALRRFRSWEQAFRSQLVPGLGRKLRRRLKWLAAAANPSRDTEVQLEWLRQELPTLTAAEVPGVEWFIQSLEHRRGMADGAFLAAIADYFAALHRRTKRALRAPVRKRGKKRRQVRPFADVVARQIVDHTDTLRQRLAAVHSAADYYEAHLARIAGKRLRYILEPLVPYVPEAELLVDRLKTLQDELGAIHDIHGFTNDIVEAAQIGASMYAKRLTLAVAHGDLAAAAAAQQANPASGMLALAARLRERRTHAFQAAEQHWLSGAADGVLDQLRTVADEFWSKHCNT